MPGGDLAAIPCYIHGVGREVLRVGSWSLAVHLLITSWLYGRGGAGDVPVIFPWREKMEKRGKHGRGAELTREWAKETLSLARITPESFPNHSRIRDVCKRGGNVIGSREIRGELGESPAKPWRSPTFRNVSF